MQKAEYEKLKARTVPNSRQHHGYEDRNGNHGEKASYRLRAFG